MVTCLLLLEPSASRVFQGSGLRKINISGYYSGRRVCWRVVGCDGYHQHWGFSYGSKI